MTFAAPLFLIAALAAAIPVVLHMVSRRKAKDLPFATLRFLKLSAQKTRRRKRIHDVLLMAIRTAVLLLLAAGLARPAVTNLAALWGGAQTAAVIVLDNSASMGMIDQDRVRLDTATAAATQILDQLAPGDQVALLPTCGPAFPEASKLDHTQDAARQMLGQCRVSYQRADLRAKLREARALLATSDAPNKQIYVLSDMQRVSWEEAGGSEPDSGDRVQDSAEKEPSPDIHLSAFSIHHSAAPPVIIVDCNRKPKLNAAVVGVDIDAPVPVVGVPVKATVTLANTSPVAQQRMVELTIDGVKQATSPELNLPPEGRVKHEFVFRIERSGLHRGEVRLVGEDGSKYDDCRFFTLDIDQGIPVAVVKSQRHEIAYLDDAFYLEQALAPGPGGNGAIRATTLLAGDLTAEPLEKYKILFCVNLPALGADAAERLRAYVAGGGNVVWICGDNVVPAAYNQMNQQAGGQLLPVALLDIRAVGAKGGRDSWHISFLDKKYPALARIAEPASLYESVLVYKHVRMAADQARVLARLDDGEPLLVERNVAGGRVLMLGASAHVAWSNLPLRPIFLPLVTQLTFALADVEQTRLNLIAGQPLVLQCGAQETPLGVELIPPSGETLRLKTTPTKPRPDASTKPRPVVAPGGAINDRGFVSPPNGAINDRGFVTGGATDDSFSGQTFRYTHTDDVGIYLVRLLDVGTARQYAYAVNLDPDEVDAAKIEPERLEALLGGAPLVLAANPDDLSSTFALLREGKSLWTPFLALVLVVLVFETFVSNRLTRKPDEPAAQQPPPGLRRLAKKM